MPSQQRWIVRERKRVRKRERGALKNVPILVHEEIFDKDNEEIFDGSMSLFCSIWLIYKLYFT